MHDDLTATCSTCCGTATSASTAAWSPRRRPTRPARARAGAGCRAVPGNATRWAMPCVPYVGQDVGLHMLPPAGAGVRSSSRPAILVPDLERLLLGAGRHRPGRRRPERQVHPHRPRLAARSTTSRASSSSTPAPRRSPSTPSIKLDSIEVGASAKTRNISVDPARGVHQRRGTRRSSIGGAHHARPCRHHPTIRRIRLVPTSGPSASSPPTPAWRKRRQGHDGWHRPSTNCCSAAHPRSTASGPCPTPARGDRRRPDQSAASSQGLALKPIVDGAPVITGPMLASQDATPRSPTPEARSTCRKEQLRLKFPLAVDQGLGRLREDRTPTPISSSSSARSSSPARASASTGPTSAAACGAEVFAL